MFHQCNKGIGQVLGVSQTMALDGKSLFHPTSRKGANRKRKHSVTAPLPNLAYSIAFDHKISKLVTAYSLVQPTAQYGGYLQQFSAVPVYKVQVSAQTVQSSKCLRLVANTTV
jgi:hypothetical protein